MNAIKWNRALYMLLGIVALTSVVKWFVGEQQFTFKFIMDCIGTSATVITAISCVFCKTAWKWGIFRNWLIMVPDLNGAWEGVLESDWIDPDTNEKIAPINATLTIRQTLFRVSCVLVTGESSSRSISSEFIIDPDSETCKLVYTYQSDPNQILQDRSRIHYGTAVLNVKGTPANKLLDGDYWTGRRTSGHMNFHRKSESNGEA